jgi:hypothetical protein
MPSVTSNVKRNYATEALNPLPHATQHDLDAVLAAYADPPDRIVNHATIIELGEFCTGMDNCDIAATFHARDVLAFCALSVRRLFRWSDYCNSHTYHLVVQPYVATKARVFAFTARRRDGETRYSWHADAFAFSRPSHVDPHANVAIDVSLAEALFRVAPRRSAMYEAMVEFNAANTDSSDVPEHVEVVMVKSALEFLFEIGDNYRELVAALDGCLGGVLLDPKEGPLRERWLERWPSSRNLLGAWAQEFCAVRWSAAHGKERGRGEFVWKERAHLAFASMLFPLLVRKVLEDRNVAPMGPLELARLKVAQSYLVVDPFHPRAVDPQGDHAWSSLESEAVWRADTLFR